MIHFLIGLLLVGGVIMLMVTSPAFRNFIFFLIVLAGIGIFFIFANQEKQTKARTEEMNAIQNQQDQARQAIKVAFDAGKIKIENVKLKNATYGLGEFILDGVATNDASQSLASLQFEVTMSDCRGTNCRIVGQQRVSASVTVPPGQMRAFSSYAIKFPDLPPISDAQRSWTYKVVSVSP